VHFETIQEVLFSVFTKKLMGGQLSVPHTTITE